MIKSIQSKIRTISDFPKPGIQYQDITTLLRDADALAMVNAVFIDRYKDQEIDYVVGIESRGFIFGGMIAAGLQKGFVPIRKQGKLPYHVHQEEYALEYGEGILEIHRDALEKGAKVLIVDDLLATGGTLSAAVSLVERAGGECVEACCLIELPELKGREKLNVPFYSILTC